MNSIANFDFTLFICFALQSPEEVKINGDAANSYGRNIGIAFQLIDDLLDFVASSEQLGKPAAADLKLGKNFEIF